MATISTITHIESGKTYVGQTWLEPEKRWQGHRSPFSGGGRSAIKSALILYGVDAFRFEAVDSAETQADLDAKEVEWIERLNSRAPNGYNLKSGGRGGRHSAETRAKISATKIAALNGHVGMTRRRRERTPEEAAAVRVEQRRKLAEKKRGTKNYGRMSPVIRSDGAVFESISAAAAAIGAARTSINKQLAGRLKTIHGFTFSRGGVPLQR